MTDHDKIKFAELMTGLAEAFGATVSKPGLALRFSALMDCSIQDIERACVQVVRSRRYTGMPTVADLREAVGANDESVEDTARIEAAKVIALCGDAASNYNKLDDPVTRAVLNMRFGGLRGVGAMPSDKLGFFERDFVELYVAYARRGVQDLGRAALASPHVLPVRGRGPVQAGEALTAAMERISVQSSAPRNTALETAREGI